MTDRITVYRDGKFQMEDAPAWWFEATERMYDNGKAVMLGDSEGVRVHANRLPIDDRGYVAYMALSDDSGVDVWAPTDADFLDLMTSRSPAFLSLGGKRT